MSAFARKVRLRESLLRQYLNGSIPGTDKAVQIAQEAGVTIEWFATGKGQKFHQVREEPATYDLGAEFELVGRYPVDAGAGPGKLVHHESEIGKLAFRRDWLRQKGLKASDLAVIRISGDSMAPTVRDGALALVDCRRQNEIPKADGIYVIQIDGELISKRIQVDLAAGGLYIRSDNPAYEDQRLTSDEAERLYIIGRIIWAGGEL